MAPKNLYEQTTSTDRAAVTAILGFDDEGAGFRNALREMAPLPEGFTCGDVLRAYLAHIAVMAGPDQCVKTHINGKQYVCIPV